jgi:hypothetical protein
VTGGLPDILKKRIAALPRNRHGARTAKALIRLYVNSLNAARVRYAAKKANRREARRTPGQRISDRSTGNILKALGAVRMLDIVEVSST